MKFLKRRDLIILAAVLLLGVCGLSSYKSSVKGMRAVAQIYYDGALVSALTADAVGQYRLAQNENVVIEQDESGVWVAQSDCPDQICVRTGKLTLAGESATCLPNKISVKLVPLNPNAIQLDTVG